MANHLQKCLDSVASQTYPNTELILVDDGSTDSSSKMALELCKAHSNCILERTENKGPGNARNRGLSLSKGELILFVDSDDHIEAEMVEKLVNALVRSKASIVLCKFQLFDENTTEVSDKAWGYPKHTISGLEAIEGMYTGKIPVTVWGKLFRGNSIEDLVFPTGLIYEDRPFMLEAFAHAKEVHFVDDVLLHVQKRENSLTRSPLSAKKIEDLTEIHHQEMALATRLNLTSAIPFIRSYHLSWLRTSFFMLQKQEKSIPTLKLIRPIFLDHVKLFHEEAFSKLPWKAKVLLQLLRFPKVIGWKLTGILMAILHPGRTL